MPGLDGVWNVERTGGLLPPLLGVRKAIRGASGRTTVGPVGVGFDVVEANDGGWNGRARYRGREYGRFRLEPRRAAKPPL